MPRKGRAKTKLAPKLKSYWKPAAVILIVIIVASVIGLTTGKGATNTAVGAKDCGKYRTDRTITIQGHTFETEVVRSSAEFEKGLGGRACIAPGRAMLFAFNQPGQYPFWMKDMKFPIDIIWVGPDRKVAAMEVNLQPSTYPNKFANQNIHPAQYVLETKAGTVAGLKIGLGTPVSF